MLLTLLISLASFLPRTNMARVAVDRVDAPASANLYYYGHVAGYEPRALVVEMVSRHLGGDLAQIDGGHVDLAGQIVINARITLQKLRLFTLAVVCFGIGVIGIGVIGSGAGVLIAALQR